MMFLSQRRVMEYIEEEVMSMNYQQNFEKDLYSWFICYEPHEHTFILMNFVGIYLDNLELTHKEKQTLLENAFHIANQVYMDKELDVEYIHSIIDVLCENGWTMDNVVIYPNNTYRLK